MDKLKVMRHFCHIAETGRFSATARDFKVPVSSLSRSMQALGAELVNHKAIYFRSSSRVLSWLKQQEGAWSAVDIEPVLISSSGYMVRSAILAGRGLGLSPLWCCTDELASGEVINVSLPEAVAATTDPTFGIYMLYYRPQYMVPKIQVAVDFFTQRLQQAPVS